MSEDSSSKPPAPIRARRWSPPPSSSTPGRPRPYRFVLRLIGIPAAAVAGVLIYSGLRDRFVLPECDSASAKHTLTDVLTEMGLAPARFDPLKTVSSSKEQVVCNAVLPLSGGSDVVVDYTFYWEGGKASMKYSISKKAPGSPAVTPP
ncbi:MAG: hypothetical protein WAL80_09195 [Xanthobacteraceae bacterium]|jgi:hypothetical protein